VTGGRRRAKKEKVYWVEVIGNENNTIIAKGVLAGVSNWPKKAGGG